VTLGAAWRPRALLAALVLLALSSLVALAVGTAAVSADPQPAPCELAEPLEPGACLGLEKTVTSVALTPELELALSGPSSAVPGDDLGYSATLSNRGSTLALSGRFRARNTAAPEASVASYYDYLEYYSKADSRWVALAGVGQATSGYTPQSEPPTASGLDLTATSRAATGVTYPTSGDPLLDTAISSEAIAAWDYTAKVELTPAQIALLLDRERVGSLRNVVHFELTREVEGGGQQVSRKTRKTYLTKQLRTQSGDLRDGEVTITPPSGSATSFTSSQEPALATLEPGASATVTHDEQLPALSPKGESESDAAYLARLQAADEEELEASAEASGKATGEAVLAAPGESLSGSELLDELDRCELVETDDCRVVVGGDRSVSAPGASATAVKRLPILSLAKSGPAKAAAGATLTYDLALENDGGAQARAIDLADRVEGGASEPSLDAPTTLEPSEGASAHASYDVPQSRPTGPLSDTATLSWDDQNQNGYGPISDDFTTRVISSTVDAPPIDPTSTTPLSEATEFLYTGSDPIQEGVSGGTIEPKRAAVLRGRVLARDGAPLFDAEVTVVGHPEFGSTHSLPDGSIYMAVNGGGPLTLRYEKEGYLAAERQVEVPWQDYAWLEDVALGPLDARVTAIDLAAPGMKVVRANPVTDADGTRQATLLFTEGTEATMELPNGDTEALSDLHVRATEFTVGDGGPEAMPGDLPPASGYTYAAEFSVDEALAAGATEVSFSQPVISYTDNFLDFPVGEAVPVGSYDHERSLWVPDQGGRVVKLLSESGGVAALDIDGSGQPATQSELEALGITDEERQRLAELYEPGKSLWRVPREHFSHADYNWATSPPSDAEGPEGQRRPGDVDESCESEGSIIACENQVLAEELVELTGSPFSLRYQSDRVPGRKASNTLEIPASGASVPQSLKRIEVQVGVAGRRFTDTLPAAPNQQYSFTWDGKDSFGRTVQGAQPATVRIGYVYDGVYEGTTRFGSSGGGAYEVRSRNEITLTRDYKEKVGHFDAQGQGLGGWTLDVHHFYDPVGQTLYLGDGGRQSAESVNRIIEHAAGKAFAPLGDGGLATQAGMTPRGVATGPDGSLYIADQGNHRIRRVSPGGIISTVAGSGSGAGFGGDGGPATQARLSSPDDVDIAPDGSLYIADQGNYRIRRVDPEGTITTVAGTGTRGTSGDGGAAIAAQLEYVEAVEVATDGGLYVAQYGPFGSNSFVRRIGPDGVITRFAGGGGGFCGDGGPATNACLSYPRGLAVGSDGSVYIADENNRRIRRVSPDGIITTVAGSNGGGTCTGDGGQATQAKLAAPKGVAVAPDGSLYIADCDRVRRVGGDGIITTVAGGGETSDNRTYGDGRPAKRGWLDTPDDIAIAPNGGMLVSDWGHWRVRRVRVPLPGFTASDIAIPSEDGSELYQFDQTGRHLRTVDTLTRATVYSFAYDSAGRLSSVTDGDGNVTQIERDGSGKPTGIVAPFGQRTSLTTNADGYLASASNPEGDATSLGYSSDGLLTSLTDPKGGVANFSYDSLGRLTRDEDRADGFKTLSRTNASDSYETTLRTALDRTSKYKVENLSSGDARRTFTDPSGLQSTLRINQDGTRTATAADGTITSLQRGPDPRFGMNSPILNSLTVTTPGGRQLSAQGSREATLSNPADPLSVQSQTDTLTVNGRSHRTVFNASTRRFTTTSPANRTTTTDIDVQGRPLRQQVTGLEALTSTYDTFGRLTGQTHGTRSSGFSYNSDGFLASFTDPLSRTTSFAYDRVGRLTREMFPDGREVAYAYDGNGNLTSVTPPSRPTHSFSHTAVDLLKDYTPPDVGSGTAPTRYAYNDDRDLTSITRPDGSQIGFSYDSGGRLRTVSQPSGDTSITYSSQTGNLASATAPGNERVDFEHDGALPTRETFSGTVSGNVSRTYGNDFRLASSSVNGADTIGYTYDQDSLLTGAGQLSLTRNSQNGLLSSTSLGSTTTSLTYNTFGEPITFGGSYNSAPLFSATYTRDSGGRIAEKSETASQGTDTYAYAYDQAGRLTDVTKDGAAPSHYTYDQNGNRLSRTSGGIATYGTYDDQDRLIQYGTKEYSYTDNGELRRGTDTSTNQTTTYDYDALGSLTKVTLPSGTVVDYVVDAGGRRIAKKRDGELVEGFLFGERALGPAAELDSQGNVRSRFVYATRPNVPDYMTRGGTTYRLITDQLGSPRLVVDAASGEVAQELDYDEFGNVTEDTNPGFQPFGFAGGLYDPDTKLVRFGARDYDPETGRWTVKDPVGFRAGDTNLYGYVLNDPVNFTDPQGLWLGGDIGLPNLPSPGEIANSVPLTGPIFSAHTLCRVGQALKDAARFAGDCVSDVWQDEAGCLYNEYQSFRRSGTGRYLRRLHKHFFKGPDPPPGPHPDIEVPPLPPWLPPRKP
jgi:RHS repeat-associated protein